MDRPWQWLVHGWNDTWRCGTISLLHGLAVTLFGQLLLMVGHDRFWLLAGAFSGLLVVAPVLATGLYAVSRALERDEPVSIRLVLRTWLSWRSHGDGAGGRDWRLVRFGLLLGLAGTGWVLTSAALITLLAPHPVQQPIDFLRYVVLNPESTLFELWLALGGVLAAPIFASCAVSLPLLLDRRIRVLHAVMASWDSVLCNPGPLALWAGFIIVLMALGTLTGLLGLIVIMPVLGHASWHAYRDLVDASAWPERTAPRRERI